jgi:hypothetical protein
MNMKTLIGIGSHGRGSGYGGSPGFRRGTFLFEMVAYVGMLSVALVVLASVFGVLMQAWKQTAARDELLHRVDLVVDTLRRDVWSATGIRAADSGDKAVDRVEIKEPGGTITWRMGDDGIVTRSDGGSGPGHTWAWKDMPRFSFAVKGAVLTVQIDGGPGGAKHERVAMVSQRMEGERP